MRRSVIAALVLLSGCVVEQMHGPAHGGTAPPPEVTTCRDEQPTGSRISREVCRTPEQRHDDELAKQSWGNRYPANPLTGDFTYPGADARHTQP